MEAEIAPLEDDFTDPFSTAPIALIDLLVDCVDDLEICNLFGWQYLNNLQPAKCLGAEC